MYRVLLQAKLDGAHSLDGTQRLADPVSKIMLNSCGGVPRVSGPKYWAFITFNQKYITQRFDLCFYCKL
jgi:hypothetical protein